MEDRTGHWPVALVEEIVKAVQRSTALKGDDTIH
jgi:hypothetical protein